MDLVRKDAVRENDGEKMVTFWKADMANFANTNHHKYLILCHRLLAGDFKEGNQ